MIYVFVLGFWMLLNCIAQVLNDVSISIIEGKRYNVYFSILRQAIKYATWSWLIYRISQEF